ncbi:Uma2 family endonuclease [Ruminococcaceae bacterium OttesenSCG-928-L11]|nr:Uma2 family endonuclease [Ruminococcaceae bacterium OttesenSCG-928-L11]
MPKPEPNRHYTYADYCTLDDDNRWELIGGVPYLMSSPCLTHQEIVGKLYLQFAGHLKGKYEKVILSPFDVRLNPDGADDTVVQPDLMVICDPSRLDEKSCVGAPDIVVEILSPSNANHDRVVKQEAYRKAGVQEYWIVDPDTETVEILLLQDSQYVVQSHSKADMISVATLASCVIDLKEVFSK